LESRTLDALVVLRSPLSHGEIPTQFARRSNVLEARTAKIIGQDGAVYTLPCISGNSLRGQMRDLAAERTCEELDLSQKSLPPSVFHLLFSGGGLKKRADGEESKLIPNIRARIRELWPFVSLFGGTVRGQFVSSRLSVGFAQPLTKQTPPGHYGCSMEDAGALPDAADLAKAISELRYARRDDAGKYCLAAAEEDDKTAALYGIQSVPAGTRFAWRLRADGTAVEHSCLRGALEAFCARGRVGGKVAIGYGDAEITMTTTGLPDVSVYSTFLRENRDAIVASIEELLSE